MQLANDVVLQITQNANCHVISRWQETISCRGAEQMRRRRVFSTSCDAPHLISVRGDNRWLTRVRRLMQLQHPTASSRRTGCSDWLVHHACATPLMVLHSRVSLQHQSMQGAQGLLSYKTGARCLACTRG